MATKSPVAVVTGAGSGIGAACAAELARRGYLAVVVDIDEAKARRQAEALGTSWRVADVSKEADMARLGQDVAESWGRADAVVACAGVLQRPLPPADLPMEEWQRVVDVDLKGVYLTCREFGGRMARAGGGAIVTISSCAAYRSTPLHAYGPAKAAVVALTETLAAEWGRSGVRVNGVAPAYTLTEELRARAERGERDLAAFGRDLLIGRPIEPVEIARAVAFLLSDDASAITGITLPVDGGLLASGVWASYGGFRPSAAESTTAA